MNVPLKYTHTFETGSYGRSVSDKGWEKLEPEHIAVWQSALELLSTRTLKLPDCIAKIEADWTPVLKKHERHYHTMKRLHGGSKDQKERDSILKGFPNRKARVRLATEIVSGDKRATAAESSLESYLYDFFLVLNVCAPGCCDFYRGTLLKKSSRTDVSLSNVDFEMALLGSFKSKWPEIKTLSLSQTVKWFDSVRPGVNQLPKNPMEKALFSLIHISKLDMDPMIIVWIFYALESLLQTKVGENFSSLVQRMILLLELDDEQAKILRRKFRDLYSIRSAIVHGGFEVAHPMHDDVLDEHIDKNFRRVRDAADYGLTALLAAMQSTILRGWKYPTFTERIHGIPVE
jgi:Apea-like HEPN